MTLTRQGWPSVVLLVAVAILAAVTSCRPEHEATTWAAPLPTSTTFALRVVATATPTAIPATVTPEPDWEGMVPGDLFTRAPDFSGAYELTASQMRSVLWWGGWPVELHHEALSASWCESGFQPARLGDGIEAVGLFQVHRSPWGRYTGTDPEQWRANPVLAARVAYAVYLYDLSRGNPPWAQWACKPTQERNWPE